VKYFDALLTPLFNLASRCPVLNVPSGFADNGVPTGVQIVARTYDDVTAFRVGAALERVRPFWGGRAPTFVHAPQSGGHVRLASLEDEWYRRRFAGAGRFYTAPQ
jgi:hypothetical protein